MGQQVYDKKSFHYNYVSQRMNSCLLQNSLIIITHMILLLPVEQRERHHMFSWYCRILHDYVTV